jgi:hypothetical protein
VECGAATGYAGKIRVAVVAGLGCLWESVAHVVWLLARLASKPSNEAAARATLKDNIKDPVYFSWRG